MVVAGKGVGAVVDVVTAAAVMLVQDARHVVRSIMSMVVGSHDAELERREYVTQLLGGQVAGTNKDEIRMVYGVESS